ncbi:MAG: transcriptional regulator [Myxococcaceae bacterium]|nr:transcriptional regulator [Myxococcaceae bacterium]
MSTCDRCHIDGLVLDLASAELRRGQELIPLGAHAFAVLACLVANAPRVVTRKELLARVWTGLHVSDGSIRQAISDARAALGDVTGKRIRTARGRGYYYTPPSARHDHPPSPPAAPEPLVGRAEELSRMRELLHAAAGGTGQALVLRGNAGVGKTSIARALVREAEELGFTAVEARAEQLAGAPPLWPWARLAQALLQRAKPSDRTRLEQAAGRAGALLGQRGAEGGHEESDDQQRFVLFEDLIRLFTACAAHSPLVLCLDDLQWLDETSLLFLTRFVRELASHPILLLLATRPTARREHRALARALDLMREEPFCCDIALRELTVEELRCLLQRFSGAAPPPDLAPRIHALTRGNPLFTCEVARLLTGSEREDEFLSRPGLELSAVIERRLHAGSELSTRCLLAASVLGDEFSRAELASLLQANHVDAAELHAALRESVDAGLLSPLAEGVRYRFSHPLMRATAYASLSSAEQRALHLRALHTIEALGPGTVGARLHELAQHSFQALEPATAERTSEYCRRAGERAQAQTAYAEAAKSYRRALSALELASTPVEPARALRLRLALGEALRSSGESLTAVQTIFREVCDEARALADGELQAHAVLCYLGQREHSFSPSRVGASFDQEELSLIDLALAGLPPDKRATRALLLSSKAYGLMYTDREQQREAAMQQAVSLARELDAPHTLARVLQIRIPVLARPDRDFEQLAVCNELVDLTRRGTSRESELRARVTRAVTLLSLGDRQAAEQDFSRVALLAEAVGCIHARQLADLWGLYRAFWEGRIDDAERLSKALYQPHAAPDPVNDGAIFLLRMHAVQYLRRGPSLELVRENERLLASFPTTSGIHTMLASGYASAGDFASARRQFDLVAAESFVGIPRGAMWLTEMSGLGDAAAAMGDVERASAVYAQLLPFSDRIKVYGFQALIGGPVSLDLGVLCLTMGQLEEAERWLLDARTRCRALGASLYEQLANYDYARLLLQRGGSEARTRARELLEEAYAFGEARDVGLLLGRAKLGLAQLDDATALAKPRLIRA